MTFTAVDIWILPTDFMVWSAGEFVYEARLYGLDGTPLWWGANICWVPFGEGGWRFAGSTRIDSTHVYGPGWLNRTGASIKVLVRADATRGYAGVDTRYNLQIDITGINENIPPLRQRARSDGLTTDTRQQKDTNPSFQRTDLWWVGRKA